MWKMRNKIQDIKHKNRLLSEILSRRSIDPSMVERLDEEPVSILNEMHLRIWEIPNMYEAVKQIIHAIENGYEIWTFNDYDADGMTSGFIMTDGLRSICDNDIYSYYPDRKEGYGLSMKFCKQIEARQQEIGKKILVITNDNGVSKVDEVAYLNQAGVEVVVTDHHEPQPELPDCLVVNPHVNHSEDAYGHHLCGAGVSWKVLKAIEAIADLQDFTDKYIYAVALGTVADMMPPHVENQAIVRVGAMMMNSRKHCPENIKTFKDFIGVKNVTADSIAWEFGPRLNATGRMGQVDIGASFFYQKTKEDVLPYVEAIEKINNERKESTKKAKKDVQKKSFDTDKAVALFDASEYSTGLTGIVAGKVLEETNRVACAYSENQDGILVGSARSPESLPMFEAFKEANKQGILKGFGGHEGAAGFQLEKENVERFENFMTAYLKPFMTEDEEQHLTEVDAVITIKDLTQENYLAINSFYYDREQFVKPSLMLEGVKVLSTRTSKNNPSNIEFEIDDGERTLKVWAWGMAEDYKAMGSPLYIDMIGNIAVNFMQKRFYTLSVQEICPTRSPLEKLKDTEVATA